MQKTTFWLLINIGLFACANAGAEEAISIQTIQPQVWLQQGDSKTELLHSSRISPGETIITGNTGQVTLQLAEAAIKVNSNTEITVAENNPNTTASPELHVRKGQLCVQFGKSLTTDAEFKINIGDTLLAAVSLSGEVCALRVENKSSIELLKGSVKLTHFVDPNLIILSQAGTKFIIEDSGAYQLAVPGVDEPLISEAIVIDTPEPAVVTKVVSEPEPKPVIETENKNAEETEDNASRKENISDEILQTIDVYISEKEPSTEEKPAPVVENNKPEHIYTVYLFSTRSEEVAQKANQKFLKAKYKTQIFTTADGEVTRYRVAASGFETYKAAQDFSKSIIGKLGVKDTWIGKQKRVSE